MTSPIDPTWEEVSGIVHGEDAGPKFANSFSRLPPEVIERILYVVDANVFASLALLNREWRRVSNSAQLYRHHLHGFHSKLSSHVDAASNSLMSDELPGLRHKFISEARKGVFEVFLRPRMTLIKLISVSPSSSAAFPQGEAFRFTFSSNGRLLLALSSSRIVVIDVTTSPVSVRHELKTLRRPVTAAVLDDGTLLAVASSTHQVNIYSLVNGEAKLIRAIALSEIPRVLTFSPEGSVLAIAYDGGIEVHALGMHALPTDRRAVRCFDVDSLSFSPDGLTLVGSSANPQNPSLVTISPPFSTDPDSELPPQELQSRMWTTQILFPDVTAGYSHVALIPPRADDDSGGWIVGYDSELKAFRLAQIDDSSAGAAYFVGPGADGQRKEPEPCIVPTASAKGELLAVGFQDSGVWVYGIPDEAVSLMGPSPTGRGQERLGAATSVCDQEHKWGSHSEKTNAERLRKIINFPRLLVHGHPLTPMEGVTATQWVNLPPSGIAGCRTYHRLVAVAPGGVTSSLANLGQENLPVDAGRIVALDFERSPRNGETIEMTIEVGEVEPESLPEQNSDLAVEVELERRRTLLNRRGGLGRSRNPPIERSATVVRHLQGPTAAPAGSQRDSHSQPNSPVHPEIEENPQGFDNPYSNAQPRSRDTLSRAATAAAANRGRHRFQNAGYAPTGRGGSREPVIPHESDADNWVPPPPPYTPDAESPLPEQLRRTLLPSLTQPVLHMSNMGNIHRLQRSQTARLGSLTQIATQRPRSTVERVENAFGPGWSGRTLVNPDGDFVVNGGEGLYGRSAVGRILPGGTHHTNIPHRKTGSIIHRKPVANGVGTSNLNASTGQNWRSLAPPIDFHDHRPINHTLHTQPSARPTSLVASPEDLYPPRRFSIHSGDYAQDRVDSAEPRLQQIDPPDSHPRPALVFGRNGPPPQLDTDLNAPFPALQQNAQAASLKGEIPGSASQSPIIGFPVPQENPDVGSLSPHAALDSSAEHSSSAPGQNFPYRPVSGRNSPISNPSFSVSSPDLHGRPDYRRLDTIYSMGSPNRAAARSRSRSQDMPRRQPLASSGTFDVGTGWVVSNSLLETRTPPDAGMEDWRARIERWNQQTIIEKKKKDSRCTIL